MANINYSKLERELTPELLRTMQIITIALTIGIIIFVSAGLFIYYGNLSDQTSHAPNEYPTRMLLYIMLGLFVVTMFTSRIIPKNILKGKSHFEEASEDGNSDLTTKLINRYKQSHIVRLATIEGVALFGGVVFLLSALGKDIYRDEFLWLSLIPII